jgi:hypothetical protein
MTTWEMRELDEFCTVEVMGWKKINPHAETSCEGADFYPTTDPAGRNGGPQAVCGGKGKGV